MVYGLFGLMYQEYIYPALIPQTAEKRALEVGEVPQEVPLDLPSKSRVVLASKAVLEVWADGDFVGKGNVPTLRNNRGAIYRSI